MWRTLCDLLNLYYREIFACPKIILETGVSLHSNLYIFQLCALPVLQQFGLLFRERLQTLEISSSQITTIINLNQCLTSCIGKTFSPSVLSLRNSLSCKFRSRKSLSGVSFLSSSGLANGPLFRRFTYRQVAFGAALVIVTGLILTSIANSFITYVITFSVLYGK